MLSKANMCSILVLVLVLSNTSNSINDAVSVISVITPSDRVPLAAVVPSLRYVNDICNVSISISNLGNTENTDAAFFDLKNKQLPLKAYVVELVRNA